MATNILEVMEEKKILFYTGILYEISILIPKFRGAGFLKSPFGGHHINKRYYELYNLFEMEIGINNAPRSIIDIDGYVALEFSTSRPPKAANLYLDEVLKVFPYCTGYKEIGKSEFYSILSK